MNPAAAVASWARPEVVAQYGAYAVMYTLMTERYIAATEASKQKMWAKYDSQTPEEKEARRLHINAQVRERKRKYKEAALEKAKEDAKLVKTEA